MLAQVQEASKKLLQAGGGTLGHKVPPLDDLKYKPNRLEVQTKRLEAQATVLEMPWAARQSI
jgi:hypothetical protein